MINADTNLSNPRRRLVALGVLASAAVLLTAQWSDVGADTPVTSAPAAQPDRADGTMTGRLVSVAPDGTIMLDELRVLSGVEAQEEAVADGFLPPGETLPNDFYLDDADSSVSTLATDDGTAITVYDCTAACTDVDVPHEQLVDGSVQFFGGNTPVVDVTWEDGVATQITEVYLP